MTAAKRSSDATVTDALAAGRAMTSAEIATTTALGRSTVTKALATLERMGKVRRTVGGRDGGRRLPDRWSLTASKGRSRAGSSTNRLRPGQLDGLVLNFIDTHAQDAAIGPTAVAKALDRSAGAVGNCLARLAAAGQVRQVNEHPRRYRSVVPRASAPNTTPQEEEP